ncbi:MAG: DedA family protein [Sulfuritalea sp.]|jgi:membrane protein YqaA with SNARE-associated domain|nr:DedA family protein [Sulfuritalea sp.]MCC7309908.1 DedA family protein [Sulfuritalea sp.]
MDFAFTAEAGLAGLFLASFLSATLLPGGSEAVLFALIRLHPEQTLPALLLATLGNTLGGMVTYYMGRLLPQHLAPEKSALAGRHGAPILLLAWAPIIGDALCAAAGWLRLPPLACAAWMAAGKAARYVVVVAGAGMV